MNALYKLNSKREEIVSWLILVTLILQIGLLLVLVKRIVSVEQYLAPPPPVIVDRIPDERGHTLGSGDTPVVVVEFADYQCPFCSEAVGPVEELVKKYSGQLRLVYRHFPLGSHEFALTAAKAAECAGEQQKFWEMHKMLFDNQNSLSNENLFAYARQLGLDLDQFTTCMQGGEVISLIEQDRKDGLRYGVNGTPTFFVNRQMVVGLSGLEDAVAQAISEAKR
jgi:protein-disulfide isomerase